MDLPSLLLENPIFVAYGKCVIVLGIQMSFVAWTTVYLMLSNDGRGMRNVEDLMKGPCNPNPNPNQLKPFEPTDKQRRIMGHHIENNISFFTVGLLYALLRAGTTTPIYVYTVLKLIHHVVYWSGQRHEIRATFWTFYNGTFLYICYLTWNTLSN